MSPFHRNAPFQAKIIKKKKGVTAAGGRRHRPQAPRLPGTSHQSPVPEHRVYGRCFWGGPMQPPQSCPPLGDGAEPPARVSRARPRASRPRAPVPARGRGAPRPTASRELPLSPLHASWVGCDKPPIRCVVTYQGDAPNPRRENYRATDFPAAPGTPAAARLRRSPLSAVITAF